MGLRSLPSRLVALLPRVAVGVDPRAAAPGTLVLLPRRRATLHCGLAGFVEVARPAPFRAPAAGAVADAARRAASGSVRALLEDPGAAPAFAAGAGELLALARELRRPAILGHPALAAVEAEAAAAAAEVRTFCDREERALEETASRLPLGVQEAVARRIVELRDAAWCLEREFLGTLAQVRDLAGPGAPPAVLRAMRKAASALDALDRIEVRGRDSEGLLLMVSFPGRAAFDAFVAALGPAVAADLAARRDREDLVDGAVTVGSPGDAARPVGMAFVRKVAAEVGRLGDNGAALRAGIRGDALLRAALAHPGTSCVVVGHTRWASNGIIHEANAHPVDNATVGRGEGGDRAAVLPQGAPHPSHGTARGRVFVALNGDVDNHIPLHEGYEAATGRRGPPRITTDTKVIALQVDRRLREGLGLEEAFRRAVADLEGSAAVAMVSDLEPGKVFLSLRGSGQSLYVGAAPDGLVLSSEVYGLVHETDRFLAMDGETERVPGDAATRGAVVVLDAGGDARLPAQVGFDGAPRAAVERTAEITTRDVDRGAFAHFFRKEIAQAPVSVARTLRGKFELEGPGGRRLRLNLGEGVLPGALVARLRSGRIRRIVCAGQGTASVAAAAIAAVLREDLGVGGVDVRAEKATELSGFGLRDDMSDTLLVAVTQSGSTADTNRAVDLARRRGAACIAIVNRRNSDITRRADGVFYTSDGRDVEMSVASTKAFHAQVVAGSVLALALARELGTLGEGELAERAADLRRAPDLLREVLALDGAVEAVASRLAPTRRHWSVVGSGIQRIAAEEVRIKCSELCYKSIPADTVEDKKHIDLSAEALMLVLAAGNPETVQGDLAKDVAIFHAHKALPVVFADRGDARYDPYAAAVIPLPPASPRLSLLAAVCAGHLFAYHAARAMDEGARFFSRIRAAVVAGHGADAGTGAGAPLLDEAAAEAAARFRARRFDAGMSAGQAADLLLRLHDGSRGAGGEAADALVGALTEAVRELERPVDAIRHQAKIVTVGTSRTTERPAGPIFDALEAAGASLDAVPDAALAGLRALAPALDAVEGWARYRVEGLDADGAPAEGTRLVLEGRGGISAKLPSRAEGGAPLKGTKRTVARARRLLVGVGAKDGRTLGIVPLLDARLHCTGMVLLHLRFRAAMTAAEKAAALGPRRLEEIVNGVSEADVAWSDALLDTVSPADLLARGPERVIEEITARARAAGRGGQPA